MADITSVESEREARLQLAKAQENAAWMAVAVYIDADGKLQLGRTSCHFPVHAYRTALELLWQNIAESLLGPKPEPLPVANLGGPMINEENHPDEVN